MRPMFALNTMSLSMTFSVLQKSVSRSDTSRNVQSALRCEASPPGVQIVYRYDSYDGIRQRCSRKISAVCYLGTEENQP